MTLYFEQRTKTYIEEVLVPALGISVFYYVMEFAEGRGQIHFHFARQGGGALRARAPLPLPAADRPAWLRRLRSAVERTVWCDPCSGELREGWVRLGRDACRD